MNAYRVKPLTFPWTPFIYLGAVSLALLLGRFMPLHFAPDWSMLFKGLGMVGAGAGLWLVVSGYAQLIRCRTALLSSSPASHLVTSGPYRFSRNPIYLGYTLLMLGAGLMSSSLWLLGGAAITAVVTHAWIIRSEEKHLLARFGCDFECYCRRTRAWI